MFSIRCSWILLNATFLTMQSINLARRTKSTSLVPAALFFTGISATLSLALSELCNTS